MSPFDFPKEPRHLDITDTERIERFRRAGYGGSVSDSLASLGVFNTVFSDRFKPLRQGMQLVGRALPIKLHSQVDLKEFPELKEKQEKMWEAAGGHPQKRMMPEEQINKCLNKGLFLRSLSQNPFIMLDNCLNAMP